MTIAYRPRAQFLGDPIPADVGVAAQYPVHKGE